MRDGLQPPTPVDLAADGLRRLDADMKGRGSLVPFERLTNSEADSWRERAGRCLAYLFAEGA